MNTGMEHVTNALFEDGYREGYKDAETGRCLIDLSDYDPEWVNGYNAGQRDSWGLS